MKTHHRIVLTAALSAFSLISVPALLRALLTGLNGPLWVASTYGAPAWLLVLGLHFTQALAFALVIGLLAFAFTLIWR